MNFRERLQERMARTGKTYHQVCRELGSAGGRRTAENKRLRADKEKKFHGEQVRQVGMKLRDADEVLSDQDRINMVMDHRKRRIE